MTDDKSPPAMGFIITKGPAESGLAGGLLKVAKGASADGSTVGIFLISDGVWLAKRGQKNGAHEAFVELLGKGAQVTVSQEHLNGAGIGDGELVDGLEVTKKTYKDLVDHVMERWDRVVVV